VAQINISKTGTAGISTPESGVIAIFANTADSGKLYYKYSDGSIAPVDTGGTGGGSGSSGTSGTSGAAGASGSSGTSGEGVPAGGTAGQVLAKIDGDDYNTQWVDQTGGGGSGSSGTSGTSGAAGASGSSGTSGAAGASGSSGTSGASGSSGTSGIGSDGSSGTSGVGTDGSSGTSGTQGPQGDPGADGSSGTSGVGTDGSSGTSGTQGPQGDPGADGSSGTSGVGTDGSSGTSGTQGPQGDPGADGSSGTSGVGTDGSSGTSGTQGPQGNPGADGSSGTSGVGTDGSSGTSGTQGPQGDPGADGSSGTSGVGTDGSSGTSGTQGPAGDSGSSGTSGTSGAPGASGSSGTSGAGSSVTILDDGTSVTTDVQSINFAGAGVVITEPTADNVVVTIAGGGGGGGISDVYNNNIRYTAYSAGSPDSDGRVRVDITSTGDLTGGLSWSRSSTTITITSTAHGLSSGDYVVVRNMGDTDYVYGAISNVSTNAFDITNAVNSGDTSGTEGAYIPAYAVTSVTDSSGDLSAVVLDGPNTGNPILHTILTYAQCADGQTESPVTFTVPTGTGGGAGGYTSKETTQPPLVSVMSMDGTGTSSYTIGSDGVSLNLSTNRNVISITGVSTFGIGILFKLNFG